VISADVLGGIYEQYLSFVQGRKGEDKSKSKRKSQGIYYTPKYIVEFIVKETLGEVLKKTKPKEISKIKVLDPACGSGSFLTAAYDKILETLAKQNPQTSLFAKFDILKENIFGVDLDAQAVEIAQLNLLLKVLSQKTKLPTLQHNISSGNSLVSGNAENLEKYFGSDYRNQRPFNFESEFKEVFEQGGFDVIIGNPPYIQLSMEEKLPSGLKEYLLDTYKSSMGRLNTFGFFIRCGIDLLEDGGYLGFIIPNTILTQDYYEELRKYILDNCAIRSIVSFDNLPFKDAVVENVVLVLQKTKSERVRNNHKVLIYKVNDDLSLIRDKSITQKLFLQSHKYGFNIHLDEKRLELKKKVEINSGPLSNFAEINQAIALKHERAKYLSKTKESSRCKPVIDGRNIGRYFINWGGIYLRYDINAIHSCKREDIFLTKEKIFFRRVGDRLVGAYDNKQLYALNTLVVINLKENIVVDIKYLLALFNSKPINWYYQSFLKSTKKVFSEIQARQIAQLPIKNLDFSKSEDKQRHDKIVSLVNDVIYTTAELQALSPNTDKHNSLKREIENLDREIDKEIYKLYGVTNEEIKTIEN
jgi:methylase of polypeptide subunit release factors